jgi:hypothetical protein
MLAIFRQKSYVRQLPNHISQITPYVVLVIGLARQCRSLQVVWQRGLLRKGLGLCHGISGNGYSFLSAFKASMQAKDYNKALAFGIFGLQVCLCADGPKRACVCWIDMYRLRCKSTNCMITDGLFSFQVKQELMLIPDRPMSLFEGLAGAICFWADLISPEMSHFPGFELPNAPPLAQRPVQRPEAT